jgi:ornithine decarboxylase
LTADTAAPALTGARAASDPARRRRYYADAAEVARMLQPSYPVFCLRPQVIAERACAFVDAFPGTTFYAVKCNPHPAVLRALYGGGVRAFDTASLAEIAQVAESFEDAERAFMHPVKPRAAIATAHRVYGISAFAVDHRDELHKLAREVRGDPQVTAVVRIATEESAGALYHLSSKFGAAPEEAAELLRETVRLGFRPGIAFHVGSQCLEPDAYRQALARVGEVLGAAGVAPAVVDVGGGFPAGYRGLPVRRLPAYMAAIRDGLAALDLPAGCRVWSEPGRALVADGQSLLVQVQLRKGRRLYINDGIYGGLSETAAVGVRYPARLIRLQDGRSAGSDAPMVSFTAYGPTCDSLDVIPDAFRLPDDVGEGDWIEIDRVGAYSNALATQFNGFHPGTFVEVADPPPGDAADSTDADARP